MGDKYRGALKAIIGAYGGMSEVSFRQARPNSDVVLEFEVDDIKRVVHFDCRTHDEGETLFCVGELHDGRWFAGNGDCDYTGWD